MVALSLVTSFDEEAEPWPLDAPCYLRASYFWASGSFAFLGLEWLSSQVSDVL